MVQGRALEEAARAAASCSVTRGAVPPFGVSGGERSRDAEDGAHAGSQVRSIAARSVSVEFPPVDPARLADPDALPRELMGDPEGTPSRTSHPRYPSRGEPLGRKALQPFPSKVSVATRPERQEEDLEGVDRVEHRLFVLRRSRL